MDFMVVRSTSPFNGIIGRPRLRKIKAVPSTTHGMIKFPVMGETLTLKSSKIIPVECAMISGPEDQSPPVNKVKEERIKVAINPEHPEQTVMIGSNLTEKTRKTPLNTEALYEEQYLGRIRANETCCEMEEEHLCGRIPSMLPGSHTTIVIAISSRSRDIVSDSPVAAGEHFGLPGLCWFVERCASLYVQFFSGEVGLASAQQICAVACCVAVAILKLISELK
ncbi:hypothetical protein Tco_0511976 [Tanacetum coccineum]